MKLRRIRCLSVVQMREAGVTSIFIIILLKDCPVGRHLCIFGLFHAVLGAAAAASTACSYWTMRRDATFCFRRKLRARNDYFIVNYATFA